MHLLVRYGHYRLRHATSASQRARLRQAIVVHERELAAIHERYGAAPSPLGTPSVTAPGVSGLGTTPGAPTAGTAHVDPTPDGEVSPPDPTAPVAGHEFFQHGIASGDPLPDAIVLWTRVTPTPDATPGSTVGPEATVAWQVARDVDFAEPVLSGSFTTDATRDHTVKLDVTGLAADTTYHYRFIFQGPWRDPQVSPVGRARTAVPDDAEPPRLRLGVVSCANLQAGWFTAYRHLAERDDLDVVVHLGDYLYEYGPGQYGYGSDETDIRPHVPAHEIVTLADYRQRHAQYKQDPDLQALHAKHSWIVTWDDHDSVANDAWDEGAENHDPATEGDFRARKTAASRAYDEWMPLRMSGTAALEGSPTDQGWHADGDANSVYRRFRFGQLAELTMLDLRTYRDQQAAIGSSSLADPGRTITGADQMSLLKEALNVDAPQWRLVGNPVTIAPLQVASLPASVQSLLSGLGGGAQLPSTAVNPDQWDGYTADRTELFDHIVDQGVRDVVFLTGDIHTSWANDLPHPAENVDLYAALGGPGGTAGVEFVGPSITSNNIKDAVPGDPASPANLAAGSAAAAAIRLLNPHIKYLDFNNHGYMVVDVTPARVRTDWWFITDRSDPHARASHAQSWAVDAGTGVVHQVTGGPVS